MTNNVVDQNGPPPHIKTKEEQTLKVAASSSATALAGAIQQCIVDGQDVILRAIGAAAVNQGVKAIAIARGHMASRAQDLWARPGFIQQPGDDGNEITVMVIRVHPF